MDEQNAIDGAYAAAWAALKLAESFDRFNAAVRDLGNAELDHCRLPGDGFREWGARISEARRAKLTRTWSNRFAKTPPRIFCGSASMKVA